MGKIEKMNSLTDWERELALLENKSNLRKLPVIRHWGREVEVNGKVMLNLSSNDYLGLAAYLPLRTEFLQSLTPDTFLPSSSSSRLLTGNFNIYVQIEDLLARLFRKESALVFNSGYHMNAGILPAVSDARTLILPINWYMPALLTAFVYRRPSVSGTGITDMTNWNSCWFPIMPGMIE